MSDKARMSIPKKYSGKPIYSFSRLDTFHNCQYSYYLGYVLKGKGVDNIFSLAGSVVHELMEDLQDRLITNEEAVSKFDVKMFELMTIQNYKFTSDAIRDNYINSIKHFLKNYKPIDKPFLSEKEFFTDIDGIVLKGFIDGIVFNTDEKIDLKNLETFVMNYDGSIDVLDYKTSSEYKGEAIKSHGRQLVLYAYALMKEWNVKINKVYWNMLKYCRIKFQGATKPREMFSLRKEWVLKIRSELKKDLRKLGYNDTDVELLLAECQRVNNLELLPEDIRNKYVVEDGIIEYEITPERIAELENFVKDTVSQINSLPTQKIEFGIPIPDDTQWKPMRLEGSRDGFFCSTLCSYRNQCRHYKAYMERLEEEKNKTPQINNNNDEIDLSVLFGS